MKERRQRNKKRHDPLEASINSYRYATNSNKATKKKGKQAQEDNVIEPRLSKKIVDVAKELQDEEEQENLKNESLENEQEENEVNLEFDENDLEEIPENDENEEDKQQYEEEFEDMPGESEDDQDGANTAQTFSSGVTLADMIMEKIREKEDQEMGDEGSESGKRRFPPKVYATYKKVGKFLKRYKSGRLPKAMKILPTLTDWDELLFLTNPEEWSPQAVYAATRIFASNLNSRLAQRYMNLILLPHVQQNLSENKKLNYHLFQALRKACFKPEAFYRGIVIPLCESGCSYKEAYVVGSVIAKQSIPADHSGAALIKLSKLPYSGSICMMMKSILLKRYAMPLAVVDALAQYFYSFIDFAIELPVIWHQTLLAFVQTYKKVLTRQQKSDLFRLCRQQSHYLITPEIRREMEQSPCREDMRL